MVSKPTARRRFIVDREAETRTLPDPCPGPGEVGIAMKASGLRGGDLRHCRAAKADRVDPSTFKVAIDDLVMRHIAPVAAPAQCAASATPKCIAAAP